MCIVQELTKIIDQYTSKIVQSNMVNAQNI